MLVFFNASTIEKIGNLGGLGALVRKTCAKPSRTKIGASTQ